MQEIWKYVSGYENVYEVSNRGNVRRVIPGAGRSKNLQLKQNNRGYLTTYLCKNGRKKCYLVHRLVAEAFCEKPNGTEVVNHIDNDPKNNCADNLEWTTQKGNIAHAARLGVMVIRPVIRSDGTTEKCYSSVRDVAADGFNPPSVCECCKGKRSRYKGFEWRYAQETKEVTAWPCTTY